MTADGLVALTQQHNRIAIMGGPRTGKTTLAAGVQDRPVFHTDDTMSIPWEDQPEEWKAHTAGLDRFVIEGVQASRCVRKGLQVDVIVVLSNPVVARTEGQARMAKGQEKIIAEAIAANPKIKVYRR